jgi:hypothetical protein
MPSGSAGSVRISIVVQLAAELGKVEKRLAAEQGKAKRLEEELACGGKRARAKGEAGAAGGYASRQSVGGCACYDFTVKAVG